MANCPEPVGAGPPESTVLVLARSSARIPACCGQGRVRAIRHSLFAIRIKIVLREQRAANSEPLLKPPVLEIEGGGFFAVTPGPLARLRTGSVEGCG
jgi:hypothetical protein